MNISKEYYKNISKQYAEISEKRAKYLNQVNDLVCQFSPKNPEKYLDIGAGDGRRSLIIAERINAQNLIMLDNCEEITPEISAIENVSLIITEVQNYFPDIKFPLITSLWNVLGHVGRENDRFSFLKSVSRLLTDDGVFITDVNNRYNIGHYGWHSVCVNGAKDVFHLKNAGYFVLGSPENKTSVYIHNPFELKKLAKKAGLKLVDEKYINYDTGKLENSWRKGQLFYAFKRK